MVTGMRKQARRGAAALTAAAALAAGTPGDAAASTAVVWDNGVTTGSPDLDAPRPSLSLAKLYLGYWVLYHGARAIRPGWRR